MAYGDPTGTNPHDQRTPLNPKSKAKRNAVEPMSAAAFIGMPWVIFTVVSVLYAFAYHHYFLVVWMVCMLFVMISILLMALKNKGANMLFLGILSLFGVVNAIICGSYNYWNHMYQFYSYDEGRAYSNVLPTEPASAHADAGKIIFSSTSHVDTTRAVGWKMSTTYCVAPILDDTQLDRVEYWAAGVDCCPARGDFACDDAFNPKAKSGVVILDTTGGDTAVSAGDTTAGFSMWKSKRDYYVKAVRLAEAHFSITSAEFPLFVRWVEDPQQIQDDYWRYGVGYLVATVCIYLLISIVAGVVLSRIASRQDKAPGQAGGAASGSG